MREHGNLFDAYEDPAGERRLGSPTILDVEAAGYDRWIDALDIDEREYLDDSTNFAEYWKRRDEIEYAKRRKLNGKPRRELPPTHRTEADRVKYHNYRAADGGQVGDLTEQQWAALRHAFRRRCAYCGKCPSVVVEHVIPISRAGATTLANVLPACRGCNTSKGRSLLVEWITEPLWWSGFELRVRVARESLPEIPEHWRAWEAHTKKP